MSVIEHDFGLSQRLTERRFRKLLNLDAMHEANIRANPLVYLERASEHIYQLEKLLFEAAQAAAPADGDEAPSSETISVNKAEYERLLSCRAILLDALTALQSGKEG